MIYGLTGKKQSGKSTAGAYLVKTLPATRVSFKDAIEKEIIEKFPDLLNAITHSLDKTDYDGRDWTLSRMFRDKPPLIRTLLQNYGTNVVRAHDPNHWIRCWMNTVYLIDGHIVEEGVRFINEADAIRSMGGIIIRINRNGLTSEDSHVSESEMDLIEPNYTITVDTGDFESLYKQLDDIIRWTTTYVPHADRI